MSGIHAPPFSSLTLFLFVFTRFFFKNAFPLPLPKWSRLFVSHRERPSSNIYLTPPQPFVFRSRIFSHPSRGGPLRAAPSSRQLRFAFPRTPRRFVFSVGVAAITPWRQTLPRVFVFSSPWLSSSPEPVAPQGFLILPDLALRFFSFLLSSPLGRRCLLRSDFFVRLSFGCMPVTFFRFFFFELSPLRLSLSRRSRMFDFSGGKPVRYLPLLFTSITVVTSG